MGAWSLARRSITTGDQLWIATCARPEEWRKGHPAPRRPRQEVADADHVVRRGGERHDPVHQRAAPMAQFPQAADGFHPAKDLLDQLPLALADGIAGVPRRATIDGRADSLLGHMRRDREIPDRRDEGR